jgi:hypothetical protein
VTTALHITLALLATPVALVLLMYGAHWALDRWGYPSAIRAFKQLGLPADIEAAALACFDKARALNRKTWWADATAPVVTFIALLFTPRDADRLPAWASRWDNNVSLNGDGEAINLSGEWLTAGKDISWPDFNAANAAGAHVYRYDDDLYAGDAYYCRGHHPRSFLARWVWVGWRNRASKLSLDLGVEIHERPEVIAGDPDASRSKPGYRVLRQGAHYQYQCFRRVGPFTLIRSYGAKLDHARNRDPDEHGSFGRVPYTAIGWSFKRAV